MADPISRDLVGELLRIHRVFTRSIGVGLKFSQQFSTTGFQDLTEREGFYNYIRALCILLDSHHTGEEMIAFPQVRIRIPTAPVDQLCADHEKIMQILDEINGLLKRADAKETDGVILAGINQAFSRLNDLWNDHIHVEEDVLSARKIYAVFKPFEQSEMSEKLSEHGQKTSEPGFLTLPFVIYNLEGEDREKMIQLMPPVLTQQLIPVVWKDKWSSMKPFLLA
jgi:hypothetical protein